MAYFMEEKASGIVVRVSGKKQAGSRARVLSKEEMSVIPRVMGSHRALKPRVGVF